MRILRIGAVFFLASLMVACGNLQLVKVAEVPMALKESSVVLSPVRVAKEDVAERAYEIPGKSVYLQQTSGGSLAVGLLFGPLGVLGNMANIDRLTKEMGQSGTGSNLYQVDALEEASKAWENSSWLQGGNDPLTRTTLKPFIVLYVADKKAGIQTVVAVRVESAVPAPVEGKIKKWAGHYYYVLESVLPSDVLQKQLADEDLNKYREAIRVGFSNIRTELLRDLSSAPLPKRPIAYVHAPTLGAMGLPGDVERSSDGKLVLRASMTNLGPLLANSPTPYLVWIFPSASQYKFDNGPVERQDK